MKVVILCGGKGARMGGSNEDNPKPLALVNGNPIIWHIMKIYSKGGYNDFILPLGYKGDMIKEYFMNYDWKNHNFIKKGRESQLVLLSEPEPWDITFIDTGIETMTGGRIKKIEKYINEETFMLTYGDGLADIDLDKLLKFHKEKGKIATVTGIIRKSQYGIMETEDGIVKSFAEKTKLDGIINGGFFVLNKGIFDYLSDNENCIFEKEPLKKLVDNGELAVYNHDGFWGAIDTYKDLIAMNETWKNFSQ